MINTSAFDNARMKPPGYSGGIVQADIGDEWDDSYDVSDFSYPQMASVYSNLANPNALTPFLQQNALNKKESSLTWGESFDAAWTGVAHGFTTYGPEQLYRAARTLARMGGVVFDTSGIQQWATDGINEQLEERIRDEWYRPDPRWMESEWGRSLYQGFANFTSSMMSHLPAAGIALAAAPFSGGASLGALLFSGTAYLAGSGATAAVAGLASYDQFMDEALEAAQKADPTITYDTLASEKFWGGVLTAVSETGTEFAGDVIGGKLAKIIGKPAAQGVGGVVSKYVRNITNNMGVELGSEAANAAFQDYIKEIYGLDSEGRIAAISNIIGPTLVSGALGGVKQSLGAEQVMSAAEIEAQLRQSTALKRRTVLSSEAATLMDRLGLSNEDNGQSAFETALLADAQAQRIAGMSENDVAAALQAIQTDSPEFQQMLQTMKNPDATLAEVVQHSLPQLESTLSDDAKLGLWEHFMNPETGGPDDTEALNSFVDYLNDPQKAIEKWNLPEGVQDSFAAMSDLFSDSVRGLSSDASIRVSREAAEYFRSNKSYQPPAHVGMRMRSAEAQTVMEKWKGKDLSTPENQQAFLAESLPHMELNLTGINAPTDAAGIFRNTYLAYKPLLDQIRAQSAQKPDDVTVASAEAVINSQPGFELFADTFKAIDGIDDKQTAIKMVLKINEDHIKTLAAQIANTDSQNTDLEFQAQTMLLNYQMMKSTDEGIGTELGRALRRRRFDKGDPRFTEKAEAILNSDRNPEARKMLWLALSNSDDAKTLEHNLNIPFRTRFADAVMEYVTSNMLAGPSTHLVNIFGNTIQVFNKTMERAFGEYLMPQTAEGVRRGETLVMLKGFWEAFGEMRKMWSNHREKSEGFFNTLRTSEDMWGSEDGTKAADAGLMKRSISGANFGLSSEHGRISGGLATVLDLLGSVTHIPYALLNHSDQVFKHVYAKGEMQALMLREAGGNKQRYQELLANPPKTIRNQAWSEATELMFQGDLGKLSKSIDQMRNTSPLLRYFLPFLKTPINVFKETVSLTPVLGRLVGRTAERLNSPDLATRQLAEAHVMVGTLIWSSALSLAAQGMLTGPGPEDPKAKRKKEAAGWLPNALKVGDDYYQIDRLDPVALIFNMAAFVTEAGDYIDQDDAQTATLFGIGQAMRLVSNRTYLSSLTEMLEFFTKPEQGVPDLLRRFGGSITPLGSMGRSLNRSVDPYMREASDMYAGFAQTVPGLSQALPEKRDFLGQVVKSHEYVGPNWLSPFKTSETTKDPIYAEIARLQDAGFSSAPIPSKYINSGDKRIKMTPEEYGVFLNLYGNGIKDKNTGLTGKEALDVLVRSAEYKGMSNADKAKKIRSVLRRYNDSAKKELMGSSTRLQKQLKIRQEGWEFLMR